MKRKVPGHYEQNVVFYQSIRTAALMITALVIFLTWELATV